MKLIKISKQGFDRLIKRCINYNTYDDPESYYELHRPKLIIVAVGNKVSWVVES